jgi:hypothetical protein
VEGHFVKGRFVEGRFVEGRFVQASTLRLLSRIGATSMCTLAYLLSLTTAY